MSDEMSVGLVIMASGLGTRFGGDKLMEPLNGKPVIKWILDVTEGLFDKRVVVTRNGGVRALCEELGIECILHDFPNRNDTVRLGLSHLMNDVDVCFFAPGDQPLIHRKSIETLIETARISADMVVRPCVGELVGSPVGFPKKYFDELLILPEKKGGNYVVSMHPDALRKVPILDEFELWDIDTADDLEKIKNILKKGI